MSVHSNQYGMAYRSRENTDPQNEAEQAMAKAGIPPPRACSCPNPAHTTDYDGTTTCIYCGRFPREQW